VRWIEPKLVAEITYLNWTADDRLRHTVYVGLREDKPANQVGPEPRGSGSSHWRIGTFLLGGKRAFRGQI
jgi:bifunctional non-homologous end joining protein LigD